MRAKSEKPERQKTSIKYGSCGLPLKNNQARALAHLLLSQSIKRPDGSLGSAAALPPCVLQPLAKTTFGRTLVSLDTFTGRIGERSRGQSQEEGESAGEA